MTGSAAKDLHVFQKICGSQALSSVLLISTHWDRIDEETGRLRERELVSRGSLWGEMIRMGSSVFRHTNDRDSAMRIIGKVVKRSSSIVLDIQRELVEERRSLWQTSAGMVVKELLAKYTTVVDDS